MSLCLGQRVLIHRLLIEKEPTLHQLDSQEKKVSLQSRVFGKRQVSFFRMLLNIQKGKAQMRKSVLGSIDLFCPSSSQSFT